MSNQRRRKGNIAINRPTAFILEYLHRHASRRGEIAGEIGVTQAPVGKGHPAIACVTPISPAISPDRKSTRLNSSHSQISYAVFCLKKKIRYTQDAFSRSGWLWPVDAKGEPLKATSYMAVGFYVAKYVNKKSDMELAAKGLGAKEWNNSLKTKLSLLPKKLFRIRMSRNFGMKMLTMTNLSTECFFFFTKPGSPATPFIPILKPIPN